LDIHRLFTTEYFDDDMYEKLLSVATERRDLRIDSAKLQSQLYAAWADFNRECDAAFEQAERSGRHQSPRKSRGTKRIDT